MFSAIKSWFNVGENNWTVRRRIVVGCVLAGWALIIYGIERDGLDQATRHLIITQTFYFLIFIIGGYMGFAVGDDINKRNALVKAHTAPSPVVEANTANVQVTPAAQANPPIRRGPPFAPTPRQETDAADSIIQRPDR